MFSNAEGACSTFRACTAHTHFYIKLAHIQCAPPLKKLQIIFCFAFSNKNLPIKMVWNAFLSANERSSERVCVPVEYAAFMSLQLLNDSAESISTYNDMVRRGYAQYNTI